MATKSEILVHGANGSFKLLVDDPNVAGLPFIVFAGPPAHGYGIVTPELPKELQQNNIMQLFVVTTDPAPKVSSGWTLQEMQMQPIDAVDAAAEYLFAYYKMARDVAEAAPTITTFGKYVKAQVAASRPQASTEELALLEYPAQR